MGSRRIRFKHAHMQKEKQGECVKISIPHPVPTCMYVKSPSAAAGLWAM